MIPPKQIAATASSVDCCHPTQLFASEIRAVTDDTRWITADGRCPTRWRPVAVVEEPASAPRCTAAEVLFRLKKLKRLPFFEEIHGLPSPDGLGDCRDITMFLMADLVRGGHAFGWLWVSGVGLFGGSREPTFHCWLEFDGWVLDAANGKLHFWERKSWYRTSGASKVTRRTPRQWKRDLGRTSPKKPASERQFFPGTASLEPN